MDNPLSQARPDDPILKVHDYARDLAYLAIMGVLPSGSRFHSTDSPHEMKTANETITAFKDKWGRGRLGRGELESPDPNVMVSFGYLMRELDSYSIPIFQITEKAFQLLERPSTAPTIFISYRRQESSAFALLIEARLRLAGVATVFVDKNIAPGDDWEQVLLQTIRQAQVLIVLIGPRTLNADSPHVEKEIAWGMQTNCRLISIWHNGHRMKAETNYPSVLAQKQFIVVEEETSKHYETAISELLNSLGYRTY
jgi:TIR domain